MRSKDTQCNNSTHHYDFQLLYLVVLMVKY